ncbi:hypothetical protein [Luteipulveratus halotolerans]|uniref:hypothetical protein n=1 Tax=Luteipulveratus halotolerans TaxID=1631356 RepID=UPI000680AF8B|nr:hypothetical protein [Luteipulveratus halotolerans]
MSNYSAAQFGATVLEDFQRRQARSSRIEMSMSRESALEPKGLGHPDYEALSVGDRRTAPMVAAFIDLTNFTGRTFWDDQDEVVDLAHAILSGFIEVVTLFGGHPLGLRGDGLFAGFSPGDPSTTAAMAALRLSA